MKVEQITNLTTKFQQQTGLPVCPNLTKAHNVFNYYYCYYCCYDDDDDDDDDDVHPLCAQTRKDVRPGL